MRRTTNLLGILMLALLLASSDSYFCYWNTNYWHSGEQIELVESSTKTGVFDPCEVQVPVSGKPRHDRAGYGVVPAEAVLQTKTNTAFHCACQHFLYSVKRSLHRSNLIAHDLSREMLFPDCC